MILGCVMGIPSQIQRIPVASQLVLAYVLIGIARRTELSLSTVDNTGPASEGNSKAV